MAGPNLLEDVANDLAIWIDQTATQVALAFAPARAPFSAQVTEEQKLEFYRTRLFNPDGTPNPQGRQAEMQRLGSEGFANVYKAVIKRYPELRVAPPPPIEVPSEWPQAAPAGPPSGPPGPPGAPPGPPAGLPPGPGGTGGLLRSPLGAGPPRPPMMPPPGVRPMARGGIVTQPTLAQSNRYAQGR